EKIEKVRELILTEVNIKELTLYSYNTPGQFVYQIKPDFKSLGPRFGNRMKEIAQKVAAFSQEDIARLQLEKTISVGLDSEEIQLELKDFGITTKEIPGWVSASDRGITVAIDTHITEELKQEGIARELVNRIQNYRKEKDLEVTDRIRLQIEKQDEILEAVNNNLHYICSETLIEKFEVVETFKKYEGITFDVESVINTTISIHKLN
ncbi:MAG: DUF5915 domain-containing protein, partial [Flavobacteriales bacterium]